MKKPIRILLYIVITLALILGLFVTIINIKGIPTYNVETVHFVHDSTPESIERGKALVSMLCAGCHMDRESGKLTGGKMLDAPKEFGEVYAPNITQDMEYGIGNWSDGEIVYLLRTGIKKDGSYAPPYMTKLPNMADDDINAIISFLRSGYHMVTADATPDRPSKPSFLTKFLSNVAFKPYQMPNTKIEMPDTTNVVEWGRYLAHNLECFACHSIDFKTIDLLEPEKSPGYFGGGNQLLNLDGQVMFTPNLTPDKETGIGNWSEDQFVKAVKYGIKDNGPALQYPMLPYAYLSDKEAKAIYTYLKTIPPISNNVERSVY